MRFLRPADKIAIALRKLPHWSQAGTMTFITWRTNDSLPKPVIDAWLSDRDHWLRLHHIEPAQSSWKADLEQLEPSAIQEYHRRFTSRWHSELDACYGDAVLRNPVMADIVKRSLLHFDGSRYEMHDFVIMPNHVHFLVVFPDEASLLEQCESWKRFTGTHINKSLDISGRFWQSDSFDHLVRHQEQYERLRRYIAENPAKARLKPGEYVHYVREEDAGSPK